jgi:uncharacterized membrane protein YedE/YeeE
MLLKLNVMPPGDAELPLYGSTLSRTLTIPCCPDGSSSYIENIFRCGAAAVAAAGSTRMMALNMLLLMMMMMMGIICGCVGVGRGGLALAMRRLAWCDARGCCMRPWPPSHRLRILLIPSEL